jgi:hypothetical protein
MTDAEKAKMRELEERLARLEQDVSFTLRLISCIAQLMEPAIDR